MTSVLIVEDDDDIRDNVARLLQLEGHETRSAADARTGLELARRSRPDVVISEAGMPGMDGFALLEAIRADPALAATSVMLLTALDDRAGMRRAMAAGADDYLAKPFTRLELLEAVSGLLKKKGRIEERIRSAVEQREEDLRRAFTETPGGGEPADRFGLQRPTEGSPGQVVQATVLFSDIRNFTALAERLNSQELAELLTRYFERICEPVLKNGGRHLKFIGDGFMCVFDPAPPGAFPLPAARRAVSAALATVLAAHEFRAWMGERFAERGLPAFAIGVGLHAGEVTLCPLGPAKETTPIGDAVNVAARLESASKELGWTVVASSAVLREAGAGIRTGGMTSVGVRGKNGFVDVAEIIGLEISPHDRRHGIGGPAGRAADLGEALRINSEITARALQDTLRSKLSAFKGYRFAADEEPLRLKGYRLSRKIGSGGMTDVYLAVRELDGLPVVVKVLEASGHAAGEQLSRFIQEYTLLSRIDHPNVVRIHDQGCTEDHAYIAMEYFEHGDLRAEIAAGPLGRQRTLQVVEQVAQALAAIHRHGIIHRDLKPENIMRRADGSVALADFGIAKTLSAAGTLPGSRLGQEDVLGTPYYLSPEQAAGGPLTPQSDLYSLGVTMFEMLSGERPFRADSLGALLARHLSAPMPPLPAAHAALQPVVERLMAKQPQQRYPSAQALLDELRQRALLPPVAEPRE